MTLFFLLSFLYPTSVPVAGKFVFAQQKIRGGSFHCRPPFFWGFCWIYCPVSLFLRSRLLTSGKGGHGICKPQGEFLTGCKFHFPPFRIPSNMSKKSTPFQRCNADCKNPYGKKVPFICFGDNITEENRRAVYTKATKRKQGGQKYVCYQYQSGKL